jgi:hypothetical protein
MTSSNINNEFAELDHFLHFSNNSLPPAPPPSRQGYSNRADFQFQYDNQQQQQQQQQQLACFSPPPAQQRQVVFCLLF